MTHPEPELLAAVDLGSNSFHMIVCRIHDGQIIVLDRIKEMVRLAAGVDENKILSEDVQARALECLDRFGQRLKEIHPKNLRIVGTNTLRSAHNSAEFINKAEECLGHSIEVISGVEEARLIYLGVAHSLAVDEERRLVMDIGGGSTEYIIGEQYKPIYLESLYMGCVSMSRRFFADGKINLKNTRLAQIAVEQELEPYSHRLINFKWQKSIGASGTIRSVAKIIQHMGWEDHGISMSSMEKLLEVMLEAGHIDKYPFHELIPDRLPVFTGGFMILYSTFKTLNINHMQVADGALREGLIQDLLGRIQHHDIRDTSSQALATRYHADLEQSERIAKATQYMLKQIARNWNLDQDSDAQWLNWASMLHEIGIDIAHSNYDRHGAYIIENSDISGFSRQEQQRLAFLVLAHRRKFPTDELQRLPSYWYLSTIRLAILLRLAVIIYRSRSNIDLNFTLQVKENTIRLAFPEGWLDEHSLTRADLEQESQYLEKIKYELTIS